MHSLKGITLVSRSVALGAALSIITACGIDVPEGKIAYAEATIQSAKDIDANKYAGVELERAKNKLQQAKEKVKEGDNEAARRLALESTATAELALAKADAKKAKIAEEQSKESLRMLKSQLK